MRSNSKDAATNDTVDTVDVKVPRALFDRVRVYCDDKNMTPYEFVIDAIGEKLALVHKERRRKPRL